MSERNIKALKRLRAVFFKVKPHRVHMNKIDDETSCGTAHCLLGWGMADPVLRKMGLRHFDWPSPALEEGVKFFGLDQETALSLFAYVVSDGGKAFVENPHAVTKRQVLASLDRVIEGKPIKPYVVKAP